MNTTAFALGAIIGFAIVMFVWVSVVVFLRWLISNWPMCYHKFEDGHGAMGDALTCTKCGLSKYPEVIDWEIRLISKIQGGD